jgi:hypothetical protein
MLRSIARCRAQKHEEACHHHKARSYTSKLQPNHGIRDTYRYNHGADRFVYRNYLSLGIAGVLCCCLGVGTPSGELKASSNDTPGKSLIL